MLTSTPTKADNLPAPLAIPHFDLGGQGQSLHFIHANGYPPACYEPLFDRLKAQYHIFGMLLRPLWPGAGPSQIRDWKPFSDDLRQFLRQESSEPVIGLGHSIGAVVTLRAALREPGLFRALILVDPVLLPPSTILQLRIMRVLGLRRPPSRLAEAALSRRRRFDDLEQLFSGYRRRDIFRFFSDENLRALVQGITRPSPDGGYELTYSPEWEAKIYQTGMWNDWDLWAGIRKLTMPVLFLRGAQTDTFFMRTADMAQQRNPALQVQTIPDATHLVPLERPEDVSAAINKFLVRENIYEG